MTDTAGIGSSGLKDSKASRGRALTIGLTGGIASGKSTAAKALEACGAHIIDADRLGHRAYEPGTAAFAAVAAAFGADVVGADGQIDRKVLGSKVFGNPHGLKQLTDIVWPEILRLARDEIDSVKNAHPQKAVVLEAAVLLEAGWQSAVDEIWVVVVDRDTALARAMARDGANADAVQKRIDAQLSNEARIEKADVVIRNDGSEQALVDQVKAQWRRLSA